MVAAITTIIGDRYKLGDDDTPWDVIDFRKRYRDMVHFLGLKATPITSTFGIGFFLLALVMLLPL